ncbi:hypothetical protein Tco_0739362 [Tanacetum coccineum]
MAPVESPQMISTCKTSYAQEGFGGNVESKKTHKNVLKQQFENFSVSDTEGLDKAYDRFQKLISQLEIHGAAVSNEDANHKFLRALPLSWNNIALIMRNKEDIDELDIDDLYNNLKVFEVDIKACHSSQRQASSSSYTNDLITPRNQGNRNGDAEYRSRDNTRRTIPVGDKVVHKELGDIMERAATTASSFEAKQESATAETSANGEVELTATIDGQVKTITKASLRRHLKLEDNGGVTTLPNSEIFEQLALMGEAVLMPHESPLHSVYSLGRDEGSLSLNELTDLCTSLSNKVQTNLEEGQEWWNDDEEDLEDPSKQGRNLIEELDIDDGISLVSSTML